MVQVQHLELTKPGGNGYHDFLQQQKKSIRFVTKTRDFTLKLKKEFKWH